MNKLTCVLIGDLGVGKTSIFNKICGTQELAIPSLESNTLKIAQSRSIEGYGFNLIDSPGIGAYQQSFTHAIGILAALTDGPIHQILLVVRYKKRIDILRQQIQESIIIIKKYYQITTIIITHWDECLKEQKTYKKISKEMIGDIFKIYSVIFSFKDISSLKLCTSIDRAILQKQNQGQQLSISNSMFEKLLQNQDFEIRLQAAKDTFIDDYETFSNTCKYFLNEFKIKSESQDCKLHDFKTFIINESKKVQQQFEKDYGALMHEVYFSKNDMEKAYIYYLCLKQKISELNQELIQIIYSKMKYSDNHPLRSLRKCPKCKMIWYKQSGCDVMVCGKSIEQNNDNQNNQNDEKQRIQNNFFQFKYRKDKKQITYKEVNKQINKQQQNQNEYQSSFNNFNHLLQINFNEDQQTNIHLLEMNIKEQIIKNGYVGCGNPFYWPAAPLVNFSDVCLEEDEIFIMLTQNQNYNFQNLKDLNIQKAQQEKKIII